MSYEGNLKNALSFSNRETQLKQFNEAWGRIATDHQIPTTLEAEAMDLDHVTSRTSVGKTYNEVVKALNSMRIAKGQISNTFDTLTSSTEGLAYIPQDAGDLADKVSTLYTLCQTVGVPQEAMDATVRNLGACLYRYTNGNVQSEHFSVQSSSALEGYRGLNTIYPAGVLSDTTYSGNIMLGAEAFGVNSNQILPDLKVAMTITLLKSYKGVTSRILHRAANETGAVQYISPNDEYYALDKSQDDSGDVRQSFSHRNNIINLYQNPNPVDMQLIPVVPKKENDVDDKFLVDDNILRPGVEINLWDMAVQPNRVGYDKFNYTDILSNKIAIRGVYVKITKGEVTENFFINTLDYPSSILNMMPTTVHDSGDHAATMQLPFQFDKDVRQVDQSSTTIFSGCFTNGDYIMGKLNFTAQANTLSAITHGMGSMSFKAVTAIEGAVPSETVKTLATELKAEITGWELDAFYSEENFRKTNQAVRSMVDVFSYTLPDGRTIVADHSLQQSLPEHVMSIANEVQTIGIDHRNLQMITKTLRSIHDRVLRERSDAQYIQNFGNLTVNKSFVSGKRVNPTVAIHTINIDDVKIFQSSDMLSDIREYVRAYIMQVLTQIHYRSLYLQALDGQAPMYKVITTTPIIECLFGLPSIHPDFMEGGMKAEGVFELKAPGKPVEYSCTLTSGVKLEFVSTAFNYMEDTMVFIPYRPNDASSDLNFAVNFDSGQFSASFNPVAGNAVNRRSLLNTREFPIVLNAIGAIIKVTGMTSKFQSLTFE